MAPEQTSSSTDVRKKRRRKVLTLHEKMTILKKLEQGRTYSSLAREYDCNESSMRTIKKCENKIKTSIMLLSNPETVKSTFLSRRDTIIEQMEHLLNVWIDEQTNQNVPLSSNMIRNKARSIYDHLKSHKPQSSSADSSFCASKGWFERFRKRANLHNIVVYSENFSSNANGGEIFKRSTCWAKVPREAASESQEQNNIQISIEKIISLSNMIEREGFSDTEQKDIVDTVVTTQKSSKDLEVSMLDSDTEIFENEEESKQEEQAESTDTNITGILKAAEMLKEKILQDDLDAERSAKVRKEIDSIMQCYTSTRKSDLQQAELVDSIRISVSASDALQFNPFNVELIKEEPGT